MESDVEIDLIPGSSNIFQIVDPDEYTCAVEEVIRPLGPHLWLRVYAHAKPNIKPFNIVFTGVRLFDGPTAWSGANFSVAPLDERLQLLNQLGWTENADSDFVEAYLKDNVLITVKPRLPRYTIRLLAYSAYRSDSSIPRHFQRVSS
jgi:hypothetical protein